ncbi:olfactory receptor 5AR1-like [Bombina bombina]|uniref:olfactory receptor 5AR1-like n=1 Tax=Bombina bombina TaxID=8345 RepID=UPI00235A646D|nr:olfactory receptor 5AR1-like [Bombina bombina]
MEHTNNTYVISFILLGLSNDPYFQVIFFLIFLLMYIITLSGNMLLIILVTTDTQLHTPMYFFLCNLSFIDICFSTSIVPKIMYNTLSKDTSISLEGCALQMYVSLSLGSTECILLAVMAYDRFVAICNPLHYNTIMSKTLCISLAAGSWVISFINAAIHVVFTFQLSYCKSNIVNHFFCEMPPFFHLSCSDTWFLEVITYISAGIIAMCAFFLIVITYIYIISAILMMQSTHNRYKAFSTCSSHLTVVSIFYGTIMFMYLRPHSSTFPESDKVVSIFYTTVTPMLNPIIYSMRNNDVKRTLKNKLSSKCMCKYDTKGIIIGFYN